VNLLIERLEYPQKTMEQTFNATITDVGFPTNFKSSHGAFNIQMGPMRKEQIESMVRWSDDYPDVGLFLDVDYFKTDLGEVTPDHLIKIIRLFNDESWGKLDSVLEKVFRK